MCNGLCGTCLSYNPDDERPGFGECEISDCQVSECQQGCIDWRNSGGPDMTESKKRHCVTAINRLTGERERISAHLAKSKAESERARLVTIRPEKRPYIYPLVAEYPKQLNLFSNNLDV